jgi:hypothetical protein
MKRKIIYYLLAFYSISTICAMAAEWVPFFKNPKNDAVWVYDREGIDFFREKKIWLGLKTTKDTSFPKVWFKSVQQSGERRLVIEMDCRDRSGRLYDDKGNVIYIDNTVDYMFGHQFKPDSVMDALYKEVCLPKPEKEKEKDDKEKDSKEKEQKDASTAISPKP